MSAAQTLGKFEIRRQLGRGAMGTVYEGWDPVIKRQVAIKTVRLPKAADDETVDEISRFRREAEAAGRLNHPNIVGVFDYGETANLAYIVMEYVDGPTLKSLLDDKEQFPLPRIARIMEDLLAGLQFSHERGVVHRDIKPANLMLTASGQTKIADFGIARIETAVITQAGTVLGTPAYMSPEQFMGLVADARSDIYSSGVLLYQLLTGERPFEGSMASIMHKALNLEAPAPSQISLATPRQFDAVISRAMAKRPEDRFRSAAEFAAAIREAVASPSASPAAAKPRANDEATVVASPRSLLSAGTPAASPATPPRRPTASAAGVASAATRRPPTPTGGNAVTGARTPVASPGVIGASLAIVAILGGIGWFLLSGGPTTSVHSPAPPRQVVASVPPPSPVPTAAPPASVPLPEPAAVPPVVQPVINPAPVAVPAAEAPPTPPQPVQAPPVPAPPAQAMVTPVPAPAVLPPAETPPVIIPPALPVLSPVIPPPPVPLSPLERVRETARSVPCSVLKVVSEQDGLGVSGLASGGQELDLLFAEARAAGRVTDAVTRVDRFACAAISTVANLARQSWEGDPRPIVLTIDRQDPVSGGRLRIDVSGQSPAVTVDLYRDDGLVHHLIRPVPTGTDSNPRTASVVVPGPGPALIVAIGSAAPLDVGNRPETEKAAGYLDTLRSRLRDAVTPAAVDIVTVTVRPGVPAAAKIPPPVPAPPRVHQNEPAVVREPLPHPAGLRSARCSNIVSRAQLGETLSNAEIAALRTECRS